MSVEEHRYSPGIESPTHGRTPYNAGCYCGAEFSTWDDDEAWPEYAAHLAAAGIGDTAAAEARGAHAVLDAVEQWDEGLAPPSLIRAAREAARNAGGGR